MPRKCLAAIVATYSIGFHTASAQTLPMLDTARVLAALEREARDTHAPGASIAVVIGDRIAFAAAVGSASVETGQPMTPQTLVRIGSITKSFTGLTALLLADRGTVDLDRAIGMYTPGLSEALRPLTLRQLLSHTLAIERHRSLETAIERVD